MQMDEINRGNSDDDIDILHLILLLLEALKLLIREQDDMLLLLQYVNTSNISRRGSYCRVSLQTELAESINNLDESVIRKHLRLSVNQFIQVEQILQPKNKGWTKRSQLMVFLFWLASGASYRVTAASFNISRFIVKEIVHNLLNEFEALVPQIIRKPDPSTYNELGNGFCQRARTHIFQRAVGAIDGCHINIKCPTALHDQYINRKLRYSIQLQAVCDHHGKFIDIFVGYPGSVHDQRVLTNSPMCLNGRFPPSGYYLLGDSGYKCSLTPIAVITPVKENRQLTEREIKFNTLHSKARNVIECSFGIMKSRWRAIFDKDLGLKIGNCVKTIAACCVLHNICLMNDNDLEFDFTESSTSSNDNENYTDEVLPEEEAGILFRNNLINEL